MLARALTTAGRCPAARNAGFWAPCRSCTTQLRSLREETKARQWEPRDPDYERVVRSMFNAQGVMAHIGATMTLVEPGRVQIEIPFRDELSQQHGFFHAGVTTTVIDSAGGFAGMTLFPPGYNVLSTEFKVNLLAPAHGDLLVATGQVVKPGRTLCVCDFEARVRSRAADGAETWTLCAVGMQTLAVMAPQQQ